jgi:hypothetical protein
MRNLMIGTLVGLVLGLLLAGNVATAQAPARAYGTDATTGVAVPIRATSGALHVNLR